jgi:hypothetical protein
MSLFHFTNQQVSKPVSEQTAPINTCKIDTVETRETFEINHVIMGHCFQAAFVQKLLKEINAIVKF